MPVIKCLIPGCTWKTDEMSEAFAGVMNTQLQMHDRLVHSVAAQPAAHKLKIDPPSIDVGATPEEWQSFKRQWSMYKTGTAIPTHQTSTALFYCCSSNLRLDIMRDMRDDVAAMPEEDLLSEMRRLAVREESVLVHRLKLGKMSQAPGMSIRTYLANLRGQAALCGFTVKCKEKDCQHVFDYSEEIIKDNLVRGISDPEILSDILGDPAPNKSLEELVNLITQKEQGKATRSAVSDCVNAMGNSRTLEKEKTQKKTFQGKCWACGGHSHGTRNDRDTREKKCPAWTSTCSRCNVKGHYSKSCSKCTHCNMWGHRDNKSKFCKKNTKAYCVEDEHLMAEQIAVMGHHIHRDGKWVESPYSNNTDQMGQIHENGSVQHHIHQNGRWVARPSRPHPVVMAEVKPMPKEHEELGQRAPKSKLKPLMVPMIADSGCMSSIMPYCSAMAMGYKKEDIMPVTMSMRGAIKENLGVEGGIVVEVCIKDKSGSERRCLQLMYVSKRMDKAFLCREALIQLGIIAEDFPEVNDNNDQVVASVSADISENTCDCPKRTSDFPPIPTSMPEGIAATTENLPVLKEWLVKRYSATTFNTCEHQPLPMMSGEPLELHVNPESRPVATHKPAMVPIHFQEKVHADLERDVRLGVLEKVVPNTPVTWCSRMVVMAKSDGSPRRTVDLQPQNKASVRQTHHVQTPFKLAEAIPQKTVKTVTDAWNGYHSVPIMEKDRHITTFITPWGRYRYKVAPQGFLASGDAYTQRFDAIITDFPNKVKCVDDTCMWAENIEQAFYQACRWLDLCGRNGITLNPKKFQFAQETVDFAGLNISSTNIKPGEKYVKSVRDFPTPKDISGARAWFGLINQAAYTFSVANKMKPFRDLLRPNNKFEWTPELENLFQESKEVIIQKMKEGVRLFEPHRPTCLATDWSVDGIGYVLKQKYCNCKRISPSCCADGWHVCLIGSRFTTATESRYAPVEGEALAVAYGLHQTRYYTLGCTKLIVATDHKPLVQILNDKSLTDISNRRLLNLKEKTMPYRFEIMHITGAKNKGPDAVSRYPVEHADDGEEKPSDDEGLQAASQDTLYIASNIITWEMVKEETAKDLSLQKVKALIVGEPIDTEDMPLLVKQYKRYLDQMTIIDGVVMIGQRIVIPTTLQPEILKALHAAHQGITMMCQRAADTVFWPGITVDITRTRENCEACHRIAKSNAKLPPEDITLPEYPFQNICADYFQYQSNNYLIVVDRYSNWPMVFQEKGKAEGLVSRLRDMFETFGAPEELTTDGGPQFTAAVTQTFLESWRVKHRLCSVGNPHANSRAEIAVKTVKRMLMQNTLPSGSLNCDAFKRAMLIYRNSIDPETGTSPSRIVFGRPTRDPIPAPLGKYCPHKAWEITAEQREKALAKRHAREREKWNKSSKELKPLDIGDNVYLQNLSGNNPLRWETTGVVVETKPHSQYAIRVDGSGRITLRNRKHLRKFIPFEVKKNFITQIPMQKICSEPTQPIRGENDKVGRELETEGNTQALERTNENPPETEIVRDNLVDVTPTIIPESPGFQTNKVQQNSQESGKSSGKIPLALRRLLPHNSAGLKE